MKDLANDQASETYYVLPGIFPRDTIAFCDCNMNSGGSYSVQRTYLWFDECCHSAPIIINIIIIIIIIIY